MHDGGEEPCIEHQMVGVGFQLVAEIPIACCRGGRDDGNALQGEGQGEFFVHLVYALLTKPVQDFLTAAGHVAKGVGGVDVENVEGISVQFVEGDLHLYKHLHSSGQGSACLTQEVGTDIVPAACPDLPPGFGDESALQRVFLNKFQIAMSAAFRRFAEFGLQPVGVMEVIVECPANGIVQFKKREVVHSWGRFPLSR